MRRFSTQVNFLDPKYREDGEPYGPWRYKELVRLNYIISKNCNTSYTDILKITPRERDYLWEFIYDDAKKAEDMIKENRQKILSRA